MNNELQNTDLSTDTLSKLVIYGDLSRLTEQQKIEYYIAFCKRVGLDPATQPFRLMTFQGKQVLYCDKGGAAQLTQLHKVSHTIVREEKKEDVYVVVTRAWTPDGRETQALGAVYLGGLKGEALANAIMKAATKSKRRATLDLLGLGVLDELEVETIRGAVVTDIITSTTALPRTSTIEAAKMLETVIQAEPATEEKKPEPQTDMGTFEDTITKAWAENLPGRKDKTKTYTKYFFETGTHGKLSSWSDTVYNQLQFLVNTGTVVTLNTQPGGRGPEIISIETPDTRESAPPPLTEDTTPSKDEQNG